jgi:hypothetical protein
MTGLSQTNLLYMRAFAEAYRDESIVQQVVGQIPWGHNVRIFDAVKDPDQRIWYIHHFSNQLDRSERSAPLTATTRPKIQELLPTKAAIACTPPQIILCQQSL